MISKLTWRGIIFIYLFLSFFLNACTRPEDNAIKPLKQYVPPQDSIPVIVSSAYVPKIYTIEISGMKFQPGEIRIHKGDTIIWKNNDVVAHCVTEATGNTWTSSKIDAGESWKMMFNTSCEYFCAIHMVMKGKIIAE